MDEPANPWRSDGRATRRELLLRRLAHMLDEMQREGIVGPAALADLVERNRTASPPAP
jgi:hypothetical protein